MAKGDINYLESNNNDCTIEDAQGENQRALLVATPGGFSGESIADTTRTAFGEVSIAPFMPLTGWAFTYNINPGVVRETILNTGTITNNQGHADLNTGVSPTGLAEIETVRSSRYIPGVGGIARFTAIFDTPQENSQQVIGLINGTDGWAFGYNGLRFGILRKVNNVEHWIYQEDWNVDVKPDFDSTKGNVFQIKYQWLGYGMQYFYMENENGDLEVVHKISYNNENTETSILNPNLPCSAYVVNSGNIIPLTLRTPSMIAGLNGDGYNDAISTNIAADATISVGAALVDVPLLSFRMSDIYKLKSNRLFCQILRFIFATEGNKPVLFRAYAGGVVTGGLWSYINEELSPLEFNNTITSYAPGERIGAFPLGKASTLEVNLIGSNFRLYANQIITITATTQGSSDLVVAGNWKSYV